MVTEIALSADPNQTFTVTIPGDTRNITLIITQSFNEQAGYWVLGINDQSNNPIVSNIPLFCGHDLLEQYQYLNNGSCYLTNVGDQALEYPNASNITDNFKLLWVL